MHTHRSSFANITNAVPSLKCISWFKESKHTHRSSCCTFPFKYEYSDSQKHLQGPADGDATPGHEVSVDQEVGFVTVNGLLSSLSAERHLIRGPVWPGAHRQLPYRYNMEQNVTNQNMEIPLDWIFTVGDLGHGPMASRLDICAHLMSEYKISKCFSCCVHLILAHEINWEGKIQDLRTLFTSSWKASQVGVSMKCTTSTIENDDSLLSKKAKKRNFFIRFLPNNNVYMKHCILSASGQKSNQVFIIPTKEFYQLKEQYRHDQRGMKSVCQLLINSVTENNTRHDTLITSYQLWPLLLHKRASNFQSLCSS